MCGRSVVLGTLVVLGGCDRAFGLTELDPGEAADATGLHDSGELDAAPSCLRDDFDGDAIDLTRWMIADQDNAPIAVNISKQRLFIALAPGRTDSYIANGLTSIVRHDMTDGFAVVDVVQAVEPGNAENYLGLQHDPLNSYVMSVGLAGILNFTVYVNGISNAESIMYDPTQHLRWRIRHDSAAAMVHFETRAGLDMWADHRVVPAFVPVTGVQLSLAAGSYVGEDPSPGGAIYDNVALVNVRCPPLQ